jgi:hypothetical protein
LFEWWLRFKMLMGKASTPPGGPPMISDAIGDSGGQSRRWRLNGRSKEMRAVRLIERAAKAGWDIPQQTKEEAVAALRRSLTCPDASPREIASAVSALAALTQAETAAVKVMVDVEERLGDRADRGYAELALEEELEGLSRG